MKVGEELCYAASEACFEGEAHRETVSVLGIAGVSLAASTGGSPADIPPASLASPPAGSVADILWQNTAPFQIPFLDEEEISDVSLATFHLFDKEDLGNSQSGIQVAFRACGGGCGCGHGGGCRGCGAAAFEAAGAAFEAAALAFAAAEAAALAFEAAASAAAVAAAAAGAGAGAAAAAFHGEAAPSARRKRLAITLTDAGRHAGI